MTVYMMQSINDKVLKHIRDLPLKFNYNINTNYLTQKVVTDSNVMANFTISSMRDFPLGVVAILLKIFILISINM